MSRSNWTVGVLSLLTLFLAALGVYGVVAFAVASRTREIGIRMAIGATRRRVLVSVLADGAKLAVPGIVLGSLLAVIVARPFLGRWYQYLGRTAIVTDDLDPLAVLGTVVMALALVLIPLGLPGTWVMVLVLGVGRTSV